MQDEILIKTYLHGTFNKSTKIIYNKWHEAFNFKQLYGI